ncbi:MAG: hypothetical protein J6S68_14335 [Acinetobacter sp.]|nr:hypothetical protein [Acinetobacter sp.]
MSVGKEREAFEAYYIANHHDGDIHPNQQLLEWSEKGEFYFASSVNDLWDMWYASANREGYKLVPINDINIADMIWDKCSCGSSRSPIISDREGYNLIHCFACGANKYIHEDY